MATYYKYADREASSQVNWSEITSNMVNSLKEVQTIRDSKRKAIDDATTELSTTLSDSPQGEHKGLNEFAMTYANNAQEMRLMQDQLLKSGQLKLKDYNIGRANLTQGTQKLFNISKKYQEHYKTKMDRLEGDLSATQEQWEMAEIEGFANFSNHEGYINPTNGQVSVGKLIDTKIDGKSVVTMDKTPGSFLTVDQLNFSVSDQVNKYSMENFDEQIGKFADTYLTTNGAYSSLDDVRQMPGFDNMKKNIIESQLGSKRDVGSILTNYVVMAPNGKQFTFTRNPEEQDENTILLVDDSTQPGSGRSEPDFSGKIGEAHKKIAYNYLDSQLEKQLPSKQTTKAPPKPTPAEKTEKSQIGLVGLWNSLYSEKEDTKRNSIVSSILESEYNKKSENMLRNIDFVSKNVGTAEKPIMQDFMELKYENSSGNRTGNNAIPLTGNYEDWASSGIAIHGIENKTKREVGLTEDSVFGGTSKSLKGTRAGRDEGRSNPTMVRQQLRAMLGNEENIFKNKADDKVATWLQSKLGPLGFTFRADKTWNNDVMVKYPGGGDAEYKLQVGNSGSAKKTKDFLDFIIPLITNEAADAFIESGMDISGGVFGESETTETKKKLPGT